MKISKLSIQGRKQATTDSGPDGSILEKKESIVIDASSRGTSQSHSVELNDTDVVELIFDDGTRWYSNAFTLHEMFPETLSANRSLQGEFLLPVSIQHSDLERGVISNLLLKVVNIFTKKTIGKNIKQLAIELEKKQLENNIGLFRLSDDFQFQRLEANAGNATYLLFLHGTASSTQGSFGDLKKTELWSHFRQQYGSNILALQHESLTKSPLENVYDLVKALPSNACLDLISQSRGGLIGETLSRFCTDDENNQGFSAAEMALFKKTYPASYFKAFQQQTEDIKKEIRSKKITVRKFIRSACPAQGTTLASKRLDNVLNITFNLVGYATGWAVTPVYIAFKNLMGSVVDCKNQVDVLPGLEAMDPNSTYIKVLNSPVSQTIDNSLQIISGNAKASASLKGLLIIASKLFFLRENDLIVDTASMYLGTKRQQLVQYFYDEGADVNHFAYFKNKKTYDALFLAIKSDGTSLLPGFTAVNQLAGEGERNAALGIEGGQVFSDTVTGTKPIVVLLPGIMGSNLAQEDELIWIKYLKLIGGELAGLRIDKEGINAPSLIKTSYKKLVDHLKEKYDVVTYPFDWRKSLPEAAEKFSTKITQLLTYHQPIKIIAHSMGGVLVRDFMVTKPAVWDQLNNSNGFRLIFLGSPLGGSYRIPAVLFGMDSIIDKLSKIDIFHTKQELLAIFSKFPGILSLLPHSLEVENDFALTDTWQKMAQAMDEWPTPNKPDLDNFGRHRNKVLAANPKLDLSNAVYIAGKDKATPCAYTLEDTSNGKKLVFLSTAEGDQSVTWESGIPKVMIENNTVYYVNVTHGALANEPSIFRAIDELLVNGSTNLISKTRPVVRGEEKLFRSKEQVDFDLSAAGIEKTLLGLSANEEPASREASVKVSVSKGDLRYSSYPMLAGHFKNDGILYAEKAIDQSMKNALSERHRLGLYPGDIGTSEVLLTDHSDFKGVIIVGLGDLGSLTSFELSKTVEQGVCKYLLDLNGKILSKKHRIAEFEKVGLSSLAIGCAFGGLSIESSVRAILLGIQNANAKIRSLQGTGSKTIEFIEFIEQYEDKALGCFYTLSKIENEENKTLNITTDTSKIRTLLGWKKRLPSESSDDWWNRINIQTYEGENRLSSLRFTIATGAAREEQRILYTNKEILEELFREISSDNQWSQEVAKTIFELLIPNDFKDQVKKQSNISWIVDKDTASYPWELLQDGINNAKPLCINAGMIRQLSTKNYRTKINAVATNNALVIADPNLKGYTNQLPGAFKEGQLVSDMFTKNGLETSTYLNETSSEIIKAIFSNDYKIIHLAGHGVFNEDPSKSSGMLIGNNVFLTTKEISQMSTVPELVFVNCCFLGKTDGVAEAYYQDRYKLAANVGTQLIENGVKVVIVAGWAVDDQAAYDFTKVFYDYMFAGYSFGDSIQKARKLIYQKYSTTNNTWGAYQCYGDPFYRLKQNSEISKTTSYKFIIAEEAEIELNNLHNEMETNRYSDTDYLGKLQSISKTVDESRLRNQKITEREALIYTDLCEYDNAIQKFETLLSMEQASFHVSTLEKYYNVKAKKYARDFISKKEKPAHLLTGLNKVIKDLDNLLLIGATGERYSLLGSAYKRKALISSTAEQKTKALEAAALHYMLAYSQQNNTYGAYCLTNWYGIQCLFSLAGTKHNWNQSIESGTVAYSLHSNSDAVKQLNILKATLNSSSDNMDFWNLAAIASIKLCLLIINPDKKNEANEWTEILQSYRHIWHSSGAKGKKIAEIEHLEIFIDALNMSRKKEAKDLSKRINQLKCELEKLL